MKAKLSEGLIDQIRKTVIVQDKHLLISDADEVLLNFLPCFENYLQNNSMWYDLKSYALFGNIKNKVSNESISNEDVLFHLENFFKNRSRQIDFVKDSINSLNNLVNRLNCLFFSLEYNYQELQPQSLHNFYLFLKSYLLISSSIKLYISFQLFARKSASFGVFASLESLSSEI